ncbi:MAG: sulfurtransferase TusA family protein [Endozoicomonadaceae bacterium]|nr:sulfurtransferase TusA family protein [Endozoicomonadaceae bacterium]
MDKKIPSLATTDNYFQGIKIDKTLDVSNYHCPLPVLKTKLMLSQLSKGQVLKVITTDSTSLQDMLLSCQLSPQALLFSEEICGTFVHLLQKQ